MLLTGVHLFDTVRWLTGAEFVTVDSRQAQLLNPAVEDFFLARAELSDGCWVSLEVSKYTQSRACWLEAVGEEAQLLADYQRGPEYDDLLRLIPAAFAALTTLRVPSTWTRRKVCPFNQRPMMIPTRWITASAEAAACSNTPLSSSVPRTAISPSG